MQIQLALFLQKYMWCVFLLHLLVINNYIFFWEQHSINIVNISSFLKNYNTERRINLSDGHPAQAYITSFENRIGQFQTFTLYHKSFLPSKCELESYSCFLYVVKQTHIKLLRPYLHTYVQQCKSVFVYLKIEKLHVHIRIHAYTRKNWFV